MLLSHLCKALDDIKTFHRREIFSFFQSSFNCLTGKKDLLTLTFFFCPFLKLAKFYQLMRAIRSVCQSTSRFEVFFRTTNVPMNIKSYLKCLSVIICCKALQIFLVIIVWMIEKNQGFLLISPFCDRTRYSLSNEKNVTNISLAVSVLIGHGKKYISFYSFL